MKKQMLKKPLQNNVAKLILFCGLLLNNNSFAQFVTTWKTNNPGISAPNQITIPTVSTETYSYTVDWGDAVIETYTVSAPPTHTYPYDGYWTISITGQFPAIRFMGVGGGGDKLKLLEINNWGTGTWSTFLGAFAGCSNLIGIFLDTPVLAPGASLGLMFNGCSAFNSNIDNWDVSTVTNMGGMFYGASSFNQPIGSWNVSSVTDMGFMFRSAGSFNQPIDTWNVGAVTNMNNMFSATSFNQNISTWNVSAVTDMGFMFEEASSFNQPIGTWSVGAVTDMSRMFASATSFNEPIGNWNVGAVNNMFGMFQNATSFNKPIGNWNVGSVNNMFSMFQNATSFNQPIGNWNVSAVNDMLSMFDQATTFNQPIGAWNVGAVTNMSYMFKNATSFNQPIGAWNVGAVTDMSYMFQNATSFNQPIGSWNVSAVNDMTDMFTGVTLSNTNYSNLLIDWDALNLNQGVNFNGGNSKYCSQAAIAAHNNIENNDLWIISDGGIDLLPTISVNFETICIGQSFTMTPGGADTYTYSSGDAVVTPTANATYTVYGTAANGCDNFATSSVTVNALPTIIATTNNTLLCVGQTATLTVSGTATSYTWSTTENTNYIAVTPTVQTTYTVDGTDANGCSNTTTITQDASLCTGIVTLLNNNISSNVYPNPSNGLLIVQLTTVAKVTLTNALGQVLISETFEAGKHSLDFTNESTGVYFVKVIENNKQQIIKVIKQ
jgi:surface protein